MNKYIQDLLLKNGFIIIDKNTMCNGICSIIDIHYSDGNFMREVKTDFGSMYSESEDIYWLIGVLVYNNYAPNMKFDKNN